MCSSYLKVFFGLQKSERTRRKYCRSILTYFAILSYAHFVSILTLFQPEKPQCGKKPCLRWRGYFHSVFVCTSLWLEKTYLPVFMKANLNCFTIQHQILSQRCLYHLLVMQIKLSLKACVISVCINSIIIYLKAVL